MVFVFLVGVPRGSPERTSGCESGARGATRAQRDSSRWQHVQWKRSHLEHGPRCSPVRLLELSLVGQRPERTWMGGLLVARLENPGMAGVLLITGVG